MSIRLLILLTILIGAFALATKASAQPDDNRDRDDDPKRVDDDRLVERIIAADVKVAGEWKGFTRQPFEKSTVEIKKDDNVIGKYCLYFDRRTSCGSCQWHETRTATYVDGMLTLNKKIDGFGGTDEPYKVLYTVRVNEAEYLVPDVNSKQLRTVDQLKQPFAYERFESRQAFRKRMGKSPLKLPTPGDK